MDTRCYTTKTFDPQAGVPCRNGEPRFRHYYDSPVSAFRITAIILSIRFGEFCFMIGLPNAEKNRCQQPITMRRHHGTRGLILLYKVSEGPLTQHLQSSSRDTVLLRAQAKGDAVNGRFAAVKTAVDRFAPGQPASHRSPLSSATPETMKVDD